jgi:hypothetical protein
MGAGTGCRRADRWMGQRGAGRSRERSVVGGAQLWKERICSGPGLPDIRGDGDYCSQDGYDRENSTLRDQRLRPAAYPCHKHDWSRTHLSMLMSRLSTCSSRRTSRRKGMLLNRVPAENVFWAVISDQEICLPKRANVTANAPTVLIPDPQVVSGHRSALILANPARALASDWGREWRPSVV